VRRHAPLTTALVSLLVLSSYVASAFVDCERPVDAGILDASRRASVMTPVPDIAGMKHAQLSTTPERMHAHAGSMDGERGVPGDSPMRAGHADHTHVAGPVPRATDEALRAVCTCGCGDQRARVGGTLSRLGATIPAIHLATLLREVRIDGPPRARSVAPRPLLLDDPVPI